MTSTVKVENLRKTFQIPHEKRTTLFENLVGMMKPSKYEIFTVLKDINFEVERGECVGIIGDNGSGKSTILKILANILRPTAGTVKVKGKVTPFLELGVGFQPDLTVRENIGVYAMIMGLSRMQIKERSYKVMDFAGLKNFQDTKLKNLSSGMQVRLAFSTAIQTDPDVLLVDEVLAVGDMEFQQKCFDVFNRYRNEGVTILFVSHDLGAVRRFCDRTLLLGGGEQMAFGDTGAILDKYVYGTKEKSGSIENQTIKSVEEDQQLISMSGNNSIKITRVQFLDKFEREGTRFNSFDSMTIRIHYYAPSKVLDPVFGIALYTEDGQYLFGTNTELKEIIIDQVEGNSYVDLKIDRITMLSGKFLLTAAVHSHDGKPYDWIDKQHSFNILPTGWDEGIFEVPCRWII